VPCAQGESGTLGIMQPPGAAPGGGVLGTLGAPQGGLGPDQPTGAAPGVGTSATLGRHQTVNE